MTLLRQIARASLLSVIVIALLQIAVGDSDLPMWLSAVVGVASAVAVTEPREDGR